MISKFALAAMLAAAVSLTGGAAFAAASDYAFEAVDGRDEEGR